MQQNAAEDDFKRISVPLTPEELEKLKKIAKVEDRSVAKTARRILREAIELAEKNGKI